MVRPPGLATSPDAPSSGLAGSPPSPGIPGGSQAVRRAAAGLAGHSLSPARLGDRWDAPDERNSRMPDDALPTQCANCRTPMPARKSPRSPSRWSGLAVSAVRGRLEVVTEPSSPRRVALGPRRSVEPDRDRGGDVLLRAHTGRTACGEQVGPQRSGHSTSATSRVSGWSALATSTCWTSRAASVKAQDSGGRRSKP
jgi:hypothetical protein